jgi:hypothetical protein
MRHFVIGYSRIVMVLLGLLFGFSHILAQDGGDFIVAYEDAASQTQLEYARFLQQRGFLESLVSNLNKQVALPHDVGVVAAPCGQPNAYWAPDQKTVVICYELFDYMGEVFRSKVSTEQELVDTILGGVEFIFYHELGHALISIFDIPYTGRQEDAVDQFSSILLLSQGKANSVLAGASFFGESRGGDTPYWDEHSLDQQRFYDIVCLLYGSNPEAYDGLLLREAGFGFGGSEGILPKQRAARCPENFKDIDRSWSRLIVENIPTIGGSSAPAITAETRPSQNVTDVVNSSSYTESFSGRLVRGDATLEEGQFFDVYELELLEGQEVTIELSSAAFDTYLAITGPNNETYFNDDAATKVNGYLSKLTIPVAQSGTYSIGVSSYGAGETGDYTVGIIQTDGVYDQVVTETLNRNDRKYQSGQFFDDYQYTFEKGQQASVVLSSLEFDAYLIVISPSGQEVSNDDYENQFGLARVDFEVKESGLYTIFATSYEAGEAGAYQLAVSDGRKAIAQQSTSQGQQNDLTAMIGKGSTTGQLSTSDTALKDGSYVDSYTVRLSSGQELSVSAVSTEFEVYIGLIKPSGQIIEGNRSQDGSLARLDIQADEAGVWYVIVTSATPQQLGSYLLSVK